MTRNIHDIAIIAMQGLLAGEPRGRDKDGDLTDNVNFVTIAEMAYQYADCMIREGKKWH